MLQTSLESNKVFPLIDAEEYRVTENLVFGISYLANSRVNLFLAVGKINQNV